MLLTVLGGFAFFSFAVTMSKTFYTPPLRKEGDKYVELDKPEMNYQYHDLVSILYSFILVGLYSANAIISGVDFEREGTEIEKHIVLLGMIWYTFD